MDLHNTLTCSEECRSISSPVSVVMLQNFRKALRYNDTVLL